MVRQLAAVAAPNDGGIVATLFLMVGAISYALFSAVSMYAALSSRSKDETRLLRLLSGCANVSNGVVHLLLVVLMYSKSESTDPFYVAELKEGYGSLIGLMTINTAVGIHSLKGGRPTAALCWNGFVALAGTFIPMVWLRFFETGLASWPYVIVLLWFGIFFMELTAVTCSATWYALE